MIIQSGMARLTMAKTSAAMKSVPDMIVNLSIFSTFKQKYGLPTPKSTAVNSYRSIKQ